MKDSSEDDAGHVVPIPSSAKPEPPSPVRRPGRIHGLAIAGMALCSLIGIGATLAFITVRWPANTGRFMIGIIFVAGMGFLFCASMAVFAAARDTYAQPAKQQDQDG